MFGCPVNRTFEGANPTLLKKIIYVVSVIRRVLVHTFVGAPKTYLWSTFNFGFAKMTKFDTFGHISPCRWGRRGKKLIKPEYILGQGPTQKILSNLQTRVQGN